MKKFAETVNKNGGVFLEARHRGKTTYEIQGLTSSPLIIFGDWVSPEDHQAEIEQLKSQLEQHQPEIPEFVAEWIKSQDHNTRNRNGTLVYEHYKKEPENDDYYPVHDWIADHFDEFLQALIYGYTVKDKRFYLKNKLTGLYLAIDSSTYIEIEEKWLDAKRITSYKPFFTQSQIDSMETGSYEQIEVEE